MRVLITGANGQLGSDVVSELNKNGISTINTDKHNMDITDQNAVSDYIKREKADAVIHCAAYTAVDAAEDNKEICELINVEGTRNIAKVCEMLDIPMMYISTDYVFDGNGIKPWTTYSERNPINYYGKTKYEGELIVEQLKKHFIVRISWVFGENGKNFVDTMLRIGKENGSVSVVNDQIGSPTYTKDLAVLLSDMIITEKYGIYHATNEGYCSWYDFALEIFDKAKLDVEVKPVSSSKFPVKAKRPNNSRLDKENLVKRNFDKLPTWQDALKRYLVQD